MSVLIREAAPPDARAIAQMYIASWRAAYRGVVSDAHLGGLGLAERERQWSQNISEPECSRCTRSTFT